MDDARTREAFRFMLENAGCMLENAGRWRSPSGRAACALALARAELRAEWEGYSFAWEYEEDFDTATDEQLARIEAGASDYVYCVCRAPRGEIVASLGGIEIDAYGRDPYARVVEAELAAEALHEADTEARERQTWANRDLATVDHG